MALSKTYTIKALFFIAMVAFTAMGTCLAEDLSLSDFSVYPQTEAFKAFVARQMNSEWHLQQSNVVAMTVFSGSDAVARRYTIAGDGQEFDVRSVYDLAEQDAEHQQLSIAELNNVRTAIEALPDSNEMPPLNRLAVVSFKKEGKWVTRAYDMQSLPTSLASIFTTIAGAKKQKFDPKTVPPLILQDAYKLALTALGQETNLYYCVSAGCLDPISGFSSAEISHGVLGWKFDFSSTNGTSQQVIVYFDRTASVPRDRHGFRTFGQ